MGATAMRGDRVAALRDQLNALREEILHTFSVYRDIVKRHALLLSQHEKERTKALNQLEQLKKTRAGLDRARSWGFELEGLHSSASQAVGCRVERDGDTLVVSVEGEIDLVSGPELLQRLERFVPGNRRVVLDLSDVSYFDLHGVRLVEQLHTMYDRKGQGFAIVATGPVLRLLRITLADGDIKVYTSRPDALMIR